MRTNELKVNLIQRILFLEDDKALNRILKVLDKEDAPLKLNSTLKSVLVKSQKSIRQGKGISHKDAMQQINQWMKRK